MQEIKGFEGRYSVTTTGLIFSHKRNRFLGCYTNKRGYQIVVLSNGKEMKSSYVHRIVCEAFLLKTGNQVNHKNGVRHDNRLENLEWCNGSENMLHASRTGLLPSGERHCKSYLTSED